MFSKGGDFVYKLTHPKFNINKKYYAVVRGNLTQKDKHKLENGIFLDKKKTAPAKINSVQYQDKKTSMEITIHEGRKRQIRLMFRSLEYHVVYLKRIQQGHLKLGNLKVGKWRKLTDKEVESFN